MRGRRPLGGETEARRGRASPPGGSRALGAVLRGGSGATPGILPPPARPQPGLFLAARSQTGWDESEAGGGDVGGPEPLQQGGGRDGRDGGVGRAQPRGAAARLRDASAPPGPVPMGAGGDAQRSAPASVSLSPGCSPGRAAALLPRETPAPPPPGHPRPFLIASGRLFCLANPYPLLCKPLSIALQTLISARLTLSRGGVGRADGKRG